MDLNKTLLVGRITKDAEKKTTSSGMVIVRFSLANGYRKKNGDQWTDETNYFDCVFMGTKAEKVSQYLTKGRQVAIDGELRQQRWEKDGQNYSKVEIIVNDLQLLTAPQSKESAQPATKAAPSPDGLKGPETFDDSDMDEIPF